MKQVPLIIKLKSDKRGQSLVELLVAMGIFVIAVSAVTSLILDVYLSDRAGRERTIATFLAGEGMEASRSIQDNSWEDLTNGSHGLALLDNKWIFQGTEEDISGYLKQGLRRIIVEEIDSNRKKITSQITWQLTENRSQELNLLTYLTNWQAELIIETCQAACQSQGYSQGVCRPPKSCPDQNEIGEIGGYDCSAKKVCCCQ